MSAKKIWYNILYYNIYHNNKILIVSKRKVCYEDEIHINKVLKSAGLNFNIFSLWWWLKTQQSVHIKVMIEYVSSMNDAEVSFSWLWTKTIQVIKLPLIYRSIIAFNVKSSFVTASILHMNLRPPRAKQSIQLCQFKYKIKKPRFRVLIPSVYTEQKMMHRFITLLLFVCKLIWNNLILCLCVYK